MGVKKRILRIFFVSIFAFIFNFISAPIAFADNNDPQYPVCNIVIEGKTVSPGSTDTINPSSVDENNAYYNIRVCGPFTQVSGDQNASPLECIENGDQKMMLAINRANAVAINGWKEFELTPSLNGCYEGVIVATRGEVWNSRGVGIDVELTASENNICADNMPVCRRVEAIFERNITANNAPACQQAIDSFTSCSFLTSSASTSELGKSIDFSGSIDELLEDQDCNTNFNTFQLVITDPDGETKINNNLRVGQFDYQFTPERLGLHNLTIRSRNVQNTVNGPIILDEIECNSSFRVCLDEQNCDPIDFEANNANNIQTDPYQICDANLDPNSDEYAKCVQCMVDQEGIWTGLGCIPTGNGGRTIIKTIVRLSIGIAGSIALLIILWASFMLSVSQGDPQKVSGAKEWLTAAIMGLLFIIFGVTILQFIGSDILQIPGFGG